MPSWCTMFLWEYLLFLQCAGRLPFLAVAVAILDPTGDRILSVFRNKKCFVWENENSRILFRIGSGPFKCRIRPHPVHLQKSLFSNIFISIFVFPKGWGHVQEGEQRWVGVARPASHVQEVAALLHFRQQPHRQGISPYKVGESCALLCFEHCCEPRSRKAIMVPKKEKN